MMASGLTTGGCAVLCMPAVATLFLLNTLGAADERVIDLTEGWRFKPDPQDAGVRDTWFAPNLDDADWAVLVAGKRWEDQGFVDLDGHAWYRRKVAVPASWQGKRAWLVLGGVNDACEVYCNGKRINSYGDASENSMALVPLIAELTDALKPGVENVLVVRVLDWGSSGGLWRSPCLLTVDESRLAGVPAVDYYTDFAGKSLTVEVDGSGLGSERPDGTLSIEISQRGKNQPAFVENIPFPSGKVRVAKTLGMVSTLLHAREPRTDWKALLPDQSGSLEYELRVMLKDAKGKLIGPSVTTVAIEEPARPAWPGEHAKLKVLNSLVTELAKYYPYPEHEWTFENPRDGWVFISGTPTAVMNGFGPETLHIDDNPEPVIFRVADSQGPREAMVYLKKGKHTFTRPVELVTFAIDVRAVPELSYCYYLSNPHIASFGPYDKAFLDKYVLPHVNTLVAAGRPSQEDLDGWIKEGRRWVTNTSLPGLSSPQAPAAPAVYEAWLKAPGATDSAFSGLIVDEFISAGAEHYKAWTEGMTQLYNDPGFRGKTFYAFCGDLHEQAHSLEFAKQLMQRGGLFALERYLTEEPTEEVADRWMRRQFQATMREWQAALPGVEKQLIFVLGCMCGPPESLDTNPSVDFNVLMEMQFRLLATDPTFFGLNGIMMYHSSYADEEAIRRYHRLVRHYCIEGRTDRLWNDPYILPHVQNPDFADGLNGWTVEPAPPGSVTTKTMEGLSHMEGRYPRTNQGETYLSMNADPQKASVVRQTVRSLTPGRTYSLQMYSFDPQHLDQNREATVGIELAGATMEPTGTGPGRSFRYVYPINYSHEFGPYTREHPAYFTFHRLVFRPEKQTVDLTLTQPAREGGEIGLNFVQVQPYEMP